MTQPLGIDDFFILEAGEYLDRLSVIASGASPPVVEELVRYSRALRGSALMANQQPIARAASGLEQVVRGLKDGRRSWDGDLAGVVREAVDTLRTLVERVRNWTPEDSARSERLALQLDASAGTAARPPSTPAPLTNETGVRAFLARESAALGSVMDQAARSLRSGTVSQETLQAVIRRMQPLRGLAAIQDFPPLPDMLDGIERTTAALSQLELSVEAGVERLEAAAKVLARAARDIADRGKPDPEAAEFQAFAALLLAAETAEPAVVPIESLFYTGEDGIAERGVAPRTPVAAGLGAAAVVSRGEHLCQSADEIAEAGSATQRDLRLHVLIGDLRTLGAGLPGGLERTVDAFAAAARGAVARGAAAAETVGFANIIRAAGVRLRGSNEVTQPNTLIQAFEELTADLERLGVELQTAITETRPAVRVPDRAPVAPAVVAPPVDESDVVPIESLEYDAEVTAPRPAAAPVPAPAATVPPTDDGWDLAASYTRLEALLAGPLSPVAPLPPRISAPIPLELPVVEIGELCYRGRAALERAGQVQRRLRQAMAQPQPQRELEPLVNELLDLVELALAD